MSARPAVAVPTVLAGRPPPGPRPRRPARRDRGAGPAPGGPPARPSGSAAGRCVRYQASAAIQRQADGIATRLPSQRLRFFLGPRSACRRSVVLVPSRILVRAGLGRGARSLVCPAGSDGQPSPRAPSRPRDTIANGAPVFDGCESVRNTLPVELRGLAVAAQARAFGCCRPASAPCRRGAVASRLIWMRKPTTFTAFRRVAATTAKPPGQ